MGPLPVALFIERWTVGVLVIRSKLESVPKPSFPPLSEVNQSLSPMSRGSVSSAGRSGRVTPRRA